MTGPRLHLFEEHPQFLFGIAYRMLGTVSDAQDLMQETYIRWQQVEAEEIRSPRAWLTTAIARLCLNHLQRPRVQRPSSPPCATAISRRCSRIFRIMSCSSPTPAAGRARCCVRCTAPIRLREPCSTPSGSTTSHPPRFVRPRSTACRGFVHFQDGHARAVLAFGLAGGRIEAVFAISNPDKLRHLSPDRHGL